MRETSEGQSGAGKKILLVEDEELVRKVCETVLRRNGYEYLVATNGAEAFEIYRNYREDICLTLSDVSMPVRTGIQLFYDILEINPHANVILMSGYSGVDIVPDDLKKLCSVVAKPFTPGALIECVQKCIQHDTQQQISGQQA